MLRPGFAIGLWAALSWSRHFTATGPDSARGRLPRRSRHSQSCWRAKFAWPRRASANRWCAPPARRAAPMVALWPLGAYALYAAGTGSLSWLRMGIAALYILTPLALAASAHAAKPGAWQDYATMLAVALPVRLGWLHGLFPYPEFRLAYILPMLLAHQCGPRGVCLRAPHGRHRIFDRLAPGVGHRGGAVLRGHRGHRYSAGNRPFTSFASIRARRIGELLPLDLLSIFAFTGWPEEFLFRGLLQNALREIPAQRKRRVGSWRRSSSGCRTSIMAFSRIGATCCWRRSPGFSTGWPGGGPGPCFPPRLCTRWWIPPGTAVPDAVKCRISSQTRSTLGHSAAPVAQLLVEDFLSTALPTPGCFYQRVRKFLKLRSLQIERV